MLKLFIESATDLFALKKASSEKAAESSGSQLETVCVIKFNGLEISRSEIVSDSHPVYNHVDSFKVDSGECLLRSKDRANSRPFYFEHVDVEVYEVDVAKASLKAAAMGGVGKESLSLIGECRVPLNRLGRQSHRIVTAMKPNPDGHINIDQSRFAVLNVMVVYDASALNSMGITNDIDKQSHLIANKKLTYLFSPHSPQYNQLYMNFNDTSPSSVIGRGNMPGPTAGEVVLDCHDGVIWSVTTHVNAFGDANRCSVIGSFVLTDLRVLFIPHSIGTPLDSVFVNSSGINIDGSRGDSYSDGNISLLRRLTIQIPIPSVDNISYSVSPASSVSDENATLTVSLRDGTVLSFCVAQSSYNPKQKRPNFLALDKLKAPSNSAVLAAAAVRKSTNPTSSVKYKTGLQTEGINPGVWCARIVDRVNWMLREDTVWIRWMKYMKASVIQDISTTDMSDWSKENEKYESWENDFIRMRVQDANWMISDVNTSYEMCPTYPQAIVMPGILTDEDVRESATERSKGRISALVWIHPDNKAALCRAAQPHYGMKAKPKADHKCLIAMKSSALHGLPVRIADARPRLNANANAIQGKGFENISHLGGERNASIVFLDIENIHIVRASFTKLKSGLLNSTESEDDSAAKSAWLTHISLILKGAVAIAESLIIGHPVLVHCSDGWDRTAQLTSLAEILLDPYYRTIKGFLILLNKEFCAFGHQFEVRLGAFDSKESSQILVQYLDSVWQIVTQRPLEFEFSPYLLQIILQCAYSGFFLSFRGNCDRERNKLLRGARVSLDLPQNETLFSSMFMYIGILLRSPIHAALLVNPHYQPPKAFNSGTNAKAQLAVSYFRPRFGLNDLRLWREGILGYLPDFQTSLCGSSTCLPHEKAAMVIVQTISEKLINSTITSSKNSSYSSSSSSSGGGGSSEVIGSMSRMGVTDIKRNTKSALESYQLFDKLDSVDNITPHISSEETLASSDPKAIRNSNNSLLFSYMKSCVKWLFQDSDCASQYALTVLAFRARATRETNSIMAKLCSQQYSTSISTDGSDISFTDLESTKPKSYKALKKFFVVLAFRRYLFEYYAILISKKVAFDNCRSLVYEIVDNAANQGIVRNPLSGIAGVDVQFVYKSTLERLNETVILGVAVSSNSARESLKTSLGFKPQSDPDVGFDNIYSSSSPSSSSSSSSSNGVASAGQAVSAFGSMLMKGFGFGGSGSTGSGSSSGSK